MFSFIDDIPSRDQMQAWVQNRLRRYGIDDAMRRSRVLQAARHFTQDEQLKIDPIGWAWQRRPTRAKMSQWRAVGFFRRHKVAIAGFCAGAAVMLILHGLIVLGDTGGLSDNGRNRTVVYPSL